ncbi:MULTISPECIES: 1,2-phenylacetyl-CoA epoxidase subunit PaaD [unclassified Haladaptatus]|uniref:1,2-phenylacetyl-CoA epoxidase subunit PaaD n=1 Tax=unclassified Haladaptatus TaxID=2622732 RepID=UPI00209BCFC0|nr:MULTISPECIES: 1,2-phenylacetyl-CoA epoxidase subunit PaaD [unclassified Haladaptatus]MCO8244211.1 metal-sulfur cluster assembly factor [Haladaptatus sp. AB643]MCO8256015.1 metal-sulfur cluster assembly factor [Haladaptatus sp. AB618]
MSNQPQEYDIDSEPTACAYTDYSETGRSPEDLPATGEGATGLEQRVWDALYDIEDPEMPISIVDLGLIYGVEVDGETPSASRDEGGDAAGANVTVIMTLTYTGCPARKMLTEDIVNGVAAVDGVEDADLELVWNPPWSIEMVTEQGKDDLREFGLSI